LFPAIEDILVLLDAFSETLKETIERSKDDRKTLFLVVAKSHLGLKEESVELVSNDQEKAV